MGVSKSTNQQGASTESRFHKVLVFTDTLQKLPSLTLIALILMFSGLLALVWGEASIIPTFYLLAASFNWVLLWLLPKLGLSYGPDRPTALALALLMALLLLLMRLFGASDQAGLVLLIVITLLTFYSTWIEPFNLRVTHQTYTTAKLAADAAPLRLLHIGDIHVERITRRERRLNHLINELKPDIIVFSGDFVNLSYNQDEQALEAVREVISVWEAPLGVYCVPGTPAVESLDRVKQFTRGLKNLRLLLNETALINSPAGKLVISGITTTHVLETDRVSLSRVLAKSPPDGLKILLTHSPDLAPEADSTGIDLYFCGHTHGGQIRLPIKGAFFSASHLGMRFVMGRHDLAHTTVYTTRGVGMEGLGAPRARFLCSPEIILWELKGQL